ncbi:uncharacterized protein LOC143430818 [Xylocopa sonorina]|uniref:uncharacterized protein LOC143430818 n=1 Tax=Xylocopa sonorina TaxID=1818115 RepID=UPI00403B3277
MFRLLIPCLIWLLGVRCESTSSMHMPDGMMEEKTAIKRESYFNPCPPDFSHSISYSPPPQLFAKSFVQPAPLQYNIPKPMITYVKPSPPPLVVKPSPLIVKPIAPPKVDFSFYNQKPMLSYAPVYQKPLYYEQSFQKLAYQPPKFYFKKFELPAIAPVIQKSQISYPVHYQSKVLQVQPPQINFLKLAQPIIHTPPVYQSSIKPFCP